MQVIILIFGGGSGGLVLLLIAALVVAAVVGSGAAAALVAALTTLLIVLAIVIGGAAVLAGVIWWATRGVRQRRAEARAEAQRLARIEYEADKERRRIERQQRLAITQAQAMAPFAAMIAQALNANQTQEDQRVHSVPYYYHAEVIDGQNE